MSFVPANTHEYFMRIALDEAELAARENEIPVGAVLVKDGEIVLRDHNRTKQHANPLAHAEKLIIDKIMASDAVFLYDYSLYVTLEPCLMCAGMLVWGRLGTLVFGTADPKSGVVGSVYNVLKDKSFNHHPIVIGKVLELECSSLLTSFFKDKR
ncbi:MAG: cytosine deaminase [Candidatus Cloacimonetes bacterium HGW-Cloacimonetes-3]|jgi:tRNA(adenine34) deaminase|nr:MAG: cytosine deaminase [Candidatus Cloacimonetes bacterium HGW-Cloacimonetes-3]